METCPKCNHDILVYDLRTKSARCLSTECQYREQMDYEQYSRRFGGKEKTLAHELSFLRNRIITAM
jgi:hypothetical protein